MCVVRIKFSECYVVVMPLVRYVTQESRYLGVAVVLVGSFRQTEVHKIDW